MNELKRLGIVINYEFLKHIRRKRVYVILLLVLVTEAAVLAGFPALMGGYPESVNLMATLLSIGPTMAVIGAIFFSGDAIAGEFENKTGFMLFTNPVKRTTLVLGKYIAGCLAVAVLTLCLYCSMCFSSGYLPDYPHRNGTVFRIMYALWGMHCCGNLSFQRRI